MRFFLILSFVLTIALPAGAQGIRDNTVTITAWQTDPSTGTARAVDQWPWLQMGGYYNMVLTLWVQPLTYEPSPNTVDYLFVSETQPDGRPARDFRLSPARTDYAYYLYQTRHRLYGKGLAQFVDQTLEVQSQPNTVPHNGQGLPLIRVTRPDQTNIQTIFLTPLYMRRLVEVLDQAAPIAETDLDKIPATFAPDRATRLTFSQPGELDTGFPNEIWIEGDFMRLLWITRRSFSFHDTMGLYQKAMFQKQLRDHFRSQGITNPATSF